MFGGLEFKNTAHMQESISLVSSHPQELFDKPLQHCHEGQDGAQIFQKPFMKEGSMNQIVRDLFSNLRNMP